jgi:hypothetical protein
VNIFRAAVGLPPENNMLLEHKLASTIAECKREREASAAAGPLKKKARTSH